MAKEGWTTAPTFAAETVGEALRLMRGRAGLTRDEVAARAGLATGTVSRYEGDVTVRPEVAAVRRMLDVMADELEADPDVLWAAFQRWLLARDRVAANAYLAAQVRAITGPTKPRRRSG